MGNGEGRCGFKSVECAHLAEDAKATRLDEIAADFFAREFRSFEHKNFQTLGG
jgi:hypothetical protein